MREFQSLTQNELAELLLPLAEAHPGKKSKRLTREEQALRRSKFQAKQLFTWVYQRGITDWDQMTDISKSLREWLKENLTIMRFAVKSKQESSDGTLKFLWDLGDHKTVESVIIPAQNDAAESDRLTACISSQVGCAMACGFCLTGVQGLDRHLKTAEIVNQVFELRKVTNLTNIVFMGMGEPLHNFDAVSKACQILLDADGMNFSKRKVTVSTSGLVPAINELGKTVDVSLAISLNATTDEQRDQIMPVNKRWNIEALLQACRNYPLGSHRRITFEYVMLKDFNDSLEDAARLEKLVAGIPSKINLIPFNEHSGSEFKRPADPTVYKFQKYLMDRGVFASVRVSRGRDISAACGQLRSKEGTARGTQKHKSWEIQKPTPSALARS